LLNNINQGIPAAPAAFFHAHRLVVGTPDQFRWLYGVLEAVVILTLLDAI